MDDVSTYALTNVLDVVTKCIESDAMSRPACYELKDGDRTLYELQQLVVNRLYRELSK